MDRIETLQLRLYRQTDRQAAIAVFEGLDLPGGITGLMESLLLGDMTKKSDLCIVLKWQELAQSQEKSPIGLKLFEIFSEFGLIDHSVWAGVESNEESQENLRKNPAV